MADYQQIVDRIRASIQSGETSGMGTPTELAEAYAKGCAEANERLQRCARYLQQGLRPEAIQLADLEPVLLDLVAILDFPERAEWDELTAEGTLPRAQALNLDAARAVNEAYATLAPLRDMLRRHRRLVLTFAPLSERLRLVRSIADHDQNNPIWGEDIAAYEKARLGEVAAEAAAIVAREDTKALEVLLAELQSPDWILSPPPQTILAVRKELARLRRLRARRRLEEFVGDLVGAFDGVDLEAGRVLRDRWEEHAREAAMAPDDPLLARATPALAWVEEEDRREAADRAYQEAVDALGQALDRGEGDRHDLRDLAESLTALGRGFPPDLRNRLDDRLADLARAHRRRTVTMVASAVAVILVVGATLFVVLSQSHRAGEIKRHVNEITYYLDKPDLEGAELYRATLKDDVLASPKMAEVLARLTSARAEETQRASDLKALIKAMKNLEVTERNPPNLAEIRDRMRDQYDEDTVKEALGKWRDDFEKNCRKAVEDFLGQIEDLRPAVEKLDARPPKLEDKVRLDKEVARLEDGLQRRLTDASPLVSIEARKPANDLLARVAAVRKGLVKLQVASRLEEDLTKASIASRTDPGPYAAAMKTYAEQFGATPRGIAIKTVLKDQPRWGGALAWSKAVRKWADNSLVTVEGQKAEDRLRECESLLAAHQSMPDIELVSKYRDFLKAIVDRDGLPVRKGDKKKGVRVELETLYHERVASKLMVVKLVKESKCYYFYNKHVPRETTRLYECILDNGVNTTEIPITPAEIAVEDAPTPQCAIAVRVNEQEILTKKPWEKATLEILKALYQPDPKQAEFDAVYRYFLLQRTAELAAKGSSSMDEALRPLIQEMKSAVLVNGVVWMNPDDPGAKATRAKAADFLANLNRRHPFAKIEKAEADYRATLLQSLKSRREPIGWLALEGRAWQCKSMKPIPKDTALWVVDSGSGPAATATWKPIGLAREGTSAIQPPDPSGLVEGSLIFAEGGR